MLRRILNLSNNVSLSKSKGRFLSDKSYGFDTVFFIAKFIKHYAINNEFEKSGLRDKAIKYIEDIFQLKEGTAGAVNYYYESLNLFEYSNLIVAISDNRYVIKDIEVLDFIAERPENAYIYLYAIVYQTFKNDGLMNLFEKYCDEDSISTKELILKDFLSLFVNKSISIGTPEANWAKQLVKYAFIVLGFANNQNYVSRTLKVKERNVTIEDISLNVAGTRTPFYLPKKNDYLHNFDKPYVLNQLSNVLVVFSNPGSVSFETVDSIASSLAELKLTILDTQYSGYTMSDYDKEQYVKQIIRTRNQAIQRQFKKSLLDNNDHKCPICGFCFEDFLIGSHIKPYSKCDDTYDAINQYNGLLLCPNHDKLFEDARYMTIDSKTGEIVLNDAAANSPDFGILKGKNISRVYIDNERRHYLKWHNDRFILLNKK